MAGFYFGPLGSMVPLVVSAGASVETGRAFSEFITSGGVRHVQRGRAAPRSWQVSRQWQDPDWVRLLSLAAHGLLGECWLYDTAAARQNMLPAALSAGTGPVVQVDGIPMGSLPAGHTARVPVLAGVTYSVAAWSASSDALYTIQHSGEPAVTVHGFDGTGVVSFTPIEDTVLTITTLRGGIAGLRVHEGYFDGRFHPGHGTPCKVAVQDPETVLQMVTGRSTISDYSVRLVEVGKPGAI